jgi:hypothetical protein
MHVCGAFAFIVSEDNSLLWSESAGKPCAMLAANYETQVRKPCGLTLQWSRHAAVPNPALRASEIR